MPIFGIETRIQTTQLEQDNIYCNKESKGNSFVRLKKQWKKNN